MIECVIHFLFFLEIICHSQLNFAQNFIHKVNINENIPCTKLEPIFNSNDFKDILLLLSDSLDDA